jgi:hypothetical protein
LAGGALHDQCEAFFIAPLKSFKEDRSCLAHQGKRLACARGSPDDGICAFAFVVSHLWREKQRSAKRWAPGKTRKNIPQGLKPKRCCAHFGAAEAAPYHQATVMAATS